MEMTNLITSPINNECETKEFKRKFQLPEFRTLMKIERNRFDYNPKKVEWVDQMFKISGMDSDKWRKIKATTLYAAYVHPFCKDIERYETLVKVWILYFIMDDHSEMGSMAKSLEESNLIVSRMAAGVKGILENKLSLSTEGWKGYNIEMFAAHKRMCATYNEVQKQRFADAWLKFTANTIDENTRVHKNYEFKQIDEIFEVRKHGIGLRTVAQSIEFADNICLTEGEWDSAQALFDIASRVIIICNDIYSFEKEYNDYTKQNIPLGVQVNVVAFTANNKQIPFEAALQEMADLCTSYEIKCLEEMKQLQSRRISENFSIFLDKMKYLIGGNYQVCSVLDRYNKLDN